MGKQCREHGLVGVCEVVTMRAHDGLDTVGADQYDLEPVDVAVVSILALGILVRRDSTSGVGELVLVDELSVVEAINQQEMD